MLTAFHQQVRFELMNILDNFCNCHFQENNCDFGLKSLPRASREQWAPSGYGWLQHRP